MVKNDREKEKKSNDRNELWMMWQNDKVQKHVYFMALFVYPVVEWMVVVVVAKQFTPEYSFYCLHYYCNFYSQNIFNESHIWPATREKIIVISSIRFHSYKNDPDIIIIIDNNHFEPVIIHNSFCSRFCVSNNNSKEQYIQL